MLNEPIYLVTGATGKAGAEVARALSARGAKVRLAARSPGSNSTDRVALDFNDPGTFAPALEGVSGIFLMRPPQVVRPARTINAFLDKAVEVGVESCTFMSVAGADSAKLLPHRKTEDHLRTLPLKWTILGPGFFDQNFTDAYLNDIKQGELALPSGNARVAFIDALDIGEAAAITLMRPTEHHGKSYHLTGGQAITFHEATAELSRQLERPVAYRPVSAFTYLREQVRRGGAIPQAAILTLIHVGLRNGSGAEISPDLPLLLGRDSTTFREFVARSISLFKKV